MKTTHISIYKVFAVIFLLLPIVFLCSCHKSPNDDPETPPEPEPLTHRTVLVYMVSTNNLGSQGYDKLDLQEMQEAARNGRLKGGRLLVYHAPYSGSPLIKEITASKIDTLYSYDGAQVSVSVEQMRDVIARTKELAPAEEYAMVLWSHANGWVQDGVSDALDDKINYSFGSDNYKKMNITALASALAGQDMKFLYFDCCYMGNIESLYELRGCTEFVAASPTEDPITGMPYQYNLEHFFAKPYDLIAAAKYTNYYYMNVEVTNCPVSYSVYRMDKIEKLASATKQIYQANDFYWPEGYEPQRLGQYRTSEYNYFFDFSHYIKEICKDPSLYDAWLDALNEVVLYTDNNGSVWGDYPIEECCGLSTYILKDASFVSTKDYSTLNWYQDIVKPE